MSTPVWMARSLDTAASPGEPARPGWPDGNPTNQREKKKTPLRRCPCPTHRPLQEGKGIEGRSAVAGRNARETGGQFLLSDRAAQREEQDEAHTRAVVVIEFSARCCGCCFLFCYPSSQTTELGRGAMRLILKANPAVAVAIG